MYQARVGPADRHEGTTAPVAGARTAAPRRSSVHDLTWVDDSPTAIRSPGQLLNCQELAARLLLQRLIIEDHALARVVLDSGEVERGQVCLQRRQIPGAGSSRFGLDERRPRPLRTSQHPAGKRGVGTYCLPF